MPLPHHRIVCGGLAAVSLAGATLSLGACMVYDSSLTFKPSGGGSRNAAGTGLPDAADEQGGATGTGGASVADDAAQESGGPSDAGGGLYDLIDDMEHEGTAIAKVHGRDGHWVAAHAKTDGGVMGPSLLNTSAIDPPRVSSFGATDAKAMHVWGAGFDGTGANVSVTLIDTPAGKAYDASAYKGVMFWARVGPAPATTAWLFKVADVNTDPAGAVCTLPAGWCFDDHAAYVEATTTWQKYELTFDELAQGGWGTPQVAKLDPTKIYSLRWQLFTATDDFDLWIDDVAFY